MDSIPLVISNFEDFLTILRKDGVISTGELANDKLEYLHKIYSKMDAKLGIFGEIGKSFIRTKTEEYGEQLEIPLPLWSAIQNWAKSFSVGEYRETFKKEPQLSLEDFLKMGGTELLYQQLLYHDLVSKNNLGNTEEHDLKMKLSSAIWNQLQEWACSYSIKEYVDKFNKQPELPLEDFLRMGGTEFLYKKYLRQDYVSRKNYDPEAIKSYFNDKELIERTTKEFLNHMHRWAHYLNFAYQRKETDPETNTDILYFPPGLISPPFLIDYTALLPKIETLTEIWLSSIGKAQPYMVVMITGFVKSGKTTALKLLSSEFQKKVNRTLHTVFMDISKIPKKDADGWFHEFYAQLEEKLLHSPKRHLRKLVPYDQTIRDILRLLESVDTSIPILFMIDEIQKFFQLGIEERTIREFLKEFLSPTGKRNNQFFGVTGSGLVTDFLKASPQDHTLAAWTYLIPMIDPNLDKEEMGDFSTKVSALCTKMLEKHFNLPPTFFKSATNANPPTLSYISALYTRFPAKKNDNVQEYLNKFFEEYAAPKFFEEFREELLPLLKSLPNEDRMCLRQYCSKKGGEKSPEELFGRICKYFEPFITILNNGRYRFRKTISTKILFLCINKDGSLKEGALQVPMQVHARIISSRLFLLV